MLARVWSMVMSLLSVGRIGVLNRLPCSFVCFAATVVLLLLCYHRCYITVATECYVFNECSSGGACCSWFLDDIVVSLHYLHLDDVVDPTLRSDYETVAIFVLLSAHWIIMRFTTRNTNG